MSDIDHFSFYGYSLKMKFAKATVWKNNCSYIDRYLMKESFVQFTERCFESCDSQMFPYVDS